LGDSRASNVIAFPDKMVATWQAYERALAVALAERTSNSPERIAVILDRIRPLYLAVAQGPSTIGMNGEEALLRINDWVSRTFTALLWELIMREMKLLNAGLE
jgi:hypothetical protein